MREICLIAVLIGLVAQVCAQDVRTIRAECPLCEARFKYNLVLQEWRSGFRLDFKQFGNPYSPTELADCPKCRFVSPSSGRGGLSDVEISLMRELVKSDRFKAAVDETSYFRLAVALETLGRPPEDIAFAYLAASWQVDDDPIRCQIYLARSLSWYDGYLAQPQPASPARIRAMLLKAEILRRMGRFGEAKVFLAELIHHPGLASQSHQNIIQQQRDLVLAKDDHPHLAVGDDASVDVTMRVTTPGWRAVRPRFTADSRLPAFPAGPYAARIPGAVTVLISVTRSGYVVSWSVKSSNAEAFSKAVLNSVRDWTFDPVPFDGGPSPIELECVVYFGIEGG